MNKLIHFYIYFVQLQPQRGFTPPPQIAAGSGPPGMHPQQRPSGASGSGFQNVANMRVSNQMPNTPSGKRQQESRAQLAANQQKRLEMCLTFNDIGHF